MFFYVFLQPEVFEEAVTDGEDALQTILAIIGGFLQNCLIAVFEDDRWEASVKEKIEEWPENMDRKRIQSLLVQLKKKKRFLYCLTPDYTEIKPDLEVVFEQAISIPLDLILIVSSRMDRASPLGTEIATRRTYFHTAFEVKRSDLAVHGKTCTPGDMDEVSFMQFHFLKALKYASEINICDRICGTKHFADNFRYTVKKLIAWLGNILSDPGACKICFHLGQPSGKGADYILDELTEYKKKFLSQTRFEVYFYDESLPDPALPHQRFILTDQIALDVDRGLDFLDKKTKKCRDNYINYQRPEDVRKLLESYVSARGQPHII